MGSIFEPITSQIGLYQGVFRLETQKVHRLLYHSLCTNLAEGAGFEPAWGFPLMVFKTTPL